LAVETILKEDSDARVGKTYRVYSFISILERRRAAGLEWVEKGRGARFIQSGTVPVNGTVPNTGTAPSFTTVPVNGTGTVPVNGTGTVPVNGIPLGSFLEIKKEPSSSAVAVQDALTRYGPTDDDAVRQLITGCREYDPEASNEEIAHFIQAKGDQLRKRRDVRNPIGMLIESVPKYFRLGSAALAAYRTEMAQDRARKAQDIAQSREIAQRTLDDPESSSRDRELALELLQGKPE
jgi:hypothetical protein